MCANCIFCEKSYLYERIIAETNNYYVVATLGQISNGGYLLPIPKNHVPCIAQIVSPEPFNIASLTDRLSAIIRAEYGCVPLIFEHGIVGKTINHAHIHLTSATHSPTDRIKRDFPNAKIDSAEGWDEPADTYLTSPEPCLLWQKSGSMTLSVYFNPLAPAQCWRIILADIIGRPERVNWQNMDPKLDKQIWMETISRLELYFK